MAAHFAYYRQQIRQEWTRTEPWVLVKSISKLKNASCDRLYPCQLD
jgi:hypothetical protein